MLFGDRGSGDRWMDASSVSGGWAVVRVRIPLARSAAAKTSFPCRTRSSCAFRFWDRALSSSCRGWSLSKKIDSSAVFSGSMVRPRVQVSKASGSLSRARRARVER